MVDLQADAIIVLSLVCVGLLAFLALVIWQLRRRGYLGKTVIVNMQGDGTQRLELAELIGLPPNMFNANAGGAVNRIEWDDVDLSTKLGQGTFGVVYRGRYRGTDVAVKELLRQDVDDHALRLFEQEFSVLNNLRHPNIVLFMGACLQIPHLAIVTEYLPRGNLHAVLNDPGQELPLRLRVHMILDICRGMTFLHSNKPPIIHRDLKSPNLLVTQDYSLKVSDFGLTTILEHTSEAEQRNQHKSFAGSVFWAAPEVLAGGQHTQASDVFSFAIITWEIITRQRLYEGAHPLSVGYQVLRQGLRPPVPIDNISFAELMQRCWAQSPDERPSFAEVTQWVEQYQADTYDHIDDVTRDLSLLDDATIDVDTAGDAAQDPAVVALRSGDGPGGLEKMTLVLHGVDNAETLWRTYPFIMRAAVSVYLKLLRSLMNAHNGIEISAAEYSMPIDRYLAAFADPADAVCFALAVQDRLNDVVWPAYVLGMKGCEPVYSNRRVGRKLYAGLSAGSIVLCAELCRERTSSGGIMYTGPGMDRLLDLSKTLQRGQILVPQDLFDGPIRDELEIAQLSVRNAGIVCFIPFYEIVPRTLGERVFKHAVELYERNDQLDAWGQSMWRIESEDLEVSTPPSDAQSTGYGMWLGAPVQFVSLGAMTDDERLAFYAETRLRMRLHHPNIHAMVGVVMETPPILVMELAERGSLPTVLEREGAALGATLRLQMVLDLARAVAYLHALQPPVLHLNIRASSLWVMNSYAVKLGYFSCVAEMLDARGVEPIFVSSQHARYNAAPCAPELLTGSRATTKTDMFNVGLVSYKILAGRPPVDLKRLGDPAVCNELVQAPPPPNASSELWALIQACWAFDPEARPAAKQMVAALVRALRSPPQEPPNINGNCVTVAMDTTPSPPNDVAVPIDT